MSQFKDRFKNINDPKTDLFLERIALQLKRFHLDKYKQKSVRDHFINHHKGQQRDVKISEILEQTPMSEEEQKALLKSIFPPFWTPRKIMLIIVISIISFFIVSCYYYIQQPRVYKLSKETLLYLDSTYSKQASESDYQTDYFENQGEFIQHGENAVSKIGYLDWLLGSSIKFYHKEKDDFINKEAKNRFVDIFSELRKNSRDYEEAVKNDKIAIIALLDTLGPGYELSANQDETESTGLELRNMICEQGTGDSRNIFIILKNENQTVGYAVKKQNQMNNINFHEFSWNAIGNFPKFKWITKKPGYDYRLYDSLKRFVAKHEFSFNHINLYQFGLP
jgi:hypothetical protein